MKYEQFQKEQINKGLKSMKRNDYSLSSSYLDMEVY